MNILKRANAIVNERSEEKERQAGPFSEPMKRGGEVYILTAPPPAKITPEGMFWALIALKLSREHYAHKEDNLLDAVAYLGGLNNLIEGEDK